MRTRFVALVALAGTAVLGTVVSPIAAAAPLASSHGPSDGHWYKFWQSYGGKRYCLTEGGGTLHMLTSCQPGDVNQKWYDGDTAAGGHYLSPASNGGICLDDEDVGIVTDGCVPPNEGGFAYQRWHFEKSSGTYWKIWHYLKGRRYCLDGANAGYDYLTISNRCQSGAYSQKWHYERAT